jgi:hypothetical protein
MHAGRTMALDVGDKRIGVAITDGLCSPTTPASRSTCWMNGLPPARRTICSTPPGADATVPRIGSSVPQ